MGATGNIQKVCITGANGFLASHIVAQCLANGYDVRGTVRNTQDTRRTQHLRELDGAFERLELFSAEMLKEIPPDFVKPLLIAMR
jgi:nucleoside-diphosphate-sugar epimerase